MRTDQPLRVLIELIDGRTGTVVATREADPFAPMLFLRWGGPDGVQIPELRALTSTGWMFERLPSRGWTVRGGRGGEDFDLVVDEPIQLVRNLLTVRLRALDLPTVVRRARIGDVDIIDVPWRRDQGEGCHLGVWQHQLVECTRRYRADELALAVLHDDDDALRRYVYAARCAVPLLWLLQAGVPLHDDAIVPHGSPRPAGQDAAGNVVIDLDGRARPGPVRVHGGPEVVLDRIDIGAGVVEGLFAEHVAFWRDLEEQAGIGVWTAEP